MEKLCTRREITNARSTSSTAKGDGSADSGTTKKRTEEKERSANKKPARVGQAGDGGKGPFSGFAGPIRLYRLIMQIVRLRDKRRGAAIAVHAPRRCSGTRPQTQQSTEARGVSATSMGTEFSRSPTTL